jgi:hypothetical protein
MLGSTTDDLRILVAKGFVIPFEDGVIVIRHWRVNNEIRQDRYKETQYKDYKERLGLTNGIYDLVLPMVPVGPENLPFWHSTIAPCTNRHVKASDLSQNPSHNQRLKI